MDKKAILEIIVRRILGYGAALLAGHGIMLSDSGKAMAVQVGIAALMALADLAWSAWDKYGRRILQAKLEIWMAAAEAHSAAMKGTNVPRPNAQQIANRVPDPKVTAAVVYDVMTGGK